MKTLNKDIFREIKNTFSRFLSIFLLAMLGVAFLAGLKTSEPSMKQSMNQYYDQYALMDVRLLSTLGVTEEDVAAAAALDCVETVEAVWTIDAFADVNGTESIVKLHTLPESLNLLTLLEGRLPEGPDEVAVEPNMLTGLELELDDTVRLDASAGSYGDFLEPGDYTVVGVVESPLYNSMERGSSTLGSGKVTYYAYLSPEAFTGERYTELYVKLIGLEGLDRYQEEYETLVEEAKPQLEDFIQARTELHRQELYDQAREELDGKWAEYEQAKTDAGRELSDAWAELTDARTSLDEGWAEYNQRLADYAAQEPEALEQLENGRAQLVSARRQLADSRAELERQKAAAQEQTAEAEARLEVAAAALEQSKAQLDEAKAVLDDLEIQISQLAGVQGMEDQLAEAQGQYTALQQQYQAGLAQYEQGMDQYQQGVAELETGKQQLAQAEAELNTAEVQLRANERRLDQVEAELNDARTRLEEAKAELDQGETDYAQGLADYEQAKMDVETELGDAETRLNDAEAQLADLAGGTGYVMDLTQLPGFSSFAQDAERVGALANVFPIIFFLVAALVCLTTMTRMVDEQRAQIGVLKALGYNKWSVAKKYIIYALVASLGGSVVGIFLGCWVIPKIIFVAYNILYCMPDMVLRLFPSLCIWSTAAAVVSTTVAAFAAVLAALRAAPAELLRPRTPKPGKRVLLERAGFLWRRISFTGKVTARNLFRYKKRLLMTVIGIGGCMALLVTGFGLQDSIFAIIDRQFENVNQFDLNVVMDPESAPEDLYAAERLMERESVTYGCLTANQTAITVNSGGKSIAAYLFSTDDTVFFTDYIRLQDRRNGESFELPQDGAVITEKLSELADVQVGDLLPLDEQGHSVRVAAITENYIMHYVYMSDQCYESVFGEDWAPNSFLLRSKDGSQASDDYLTERLVALGTVVSVSNLKAQANSFRDSMNVVNYAVMVIIVAAAALAFVVLYNLTNINITERKRELATIKVLGFYDREVSGYIYRENIWLTLMGMALGVVLGKFLHSWLVLTVEVDLVMFGRSAEPSSYVYALLLTLVFALLVNVAAHFYIKKIDMVESLKSVE